MVIVWEFAVKGLAVLLTAAVGWLCIYIISRTIFIAYFQTKTTFGKPNPYIKENRDGKEN